MTTDERLLPCPFCGSAAQVNGTASPDQWVAYCNRNNWCASVRENTRAEVIAAWNAHQGGVMTDNLRARPFGSGSRPTDQANLRCPDASRIDPSRLRLAFERVGAALSAVDCGYGHFITGDNLKVMDVQIIFDFAKASSIEAQRATTAKHGVVHESAVGEAETPTTEGDS